MPPKKTFSSDDFSVSSTSSRIRSNVAADLITKSEAALSSQASVYTQRSISSQQSQLNFGMVQHEDIEFNREEIGEVFITREQQEMIQKILQLARKGKVNSKNAFEIPIKVVHSEANSSINNKFWKFASQLLDASMFIYDKRVENMYVSIGAFENKLSRIGFNIKDKRQQDEDKLDDVNAQEQIRRDKNRQQRQMMLKISADDFSGALNLDDSEIIGFQSIQKKDKLDIKNIENKFIADPTFEKTQKLFDSFSLKSLMLNIFNLSTDLNVGLFHKSDLEKHKDNNSQSNTQNDMLKKKKTSSQNNLVNDDGLEVERQDQSQVVESQHSQSPTNYQVNSQASIDFGNSSLSYDLERHLNVTKNLIKQKPLLEQITSFIAKQPELKQDYLQRQNVQKRKNPELHQLEDGFNQQSVHATYGEIIEKERVQFIELFKEFNEHIIQDEFGNRQANHDFNNSIGLYQTHETQSQNFDQSQSNFLTSLSNNQQLQDYLQTNSMPVSIQESFFSWNEQSNIIEPIMPWEIQFKNLKLTKKRKKPQRNQSKKSKSNKQSASATSVVDFGLQIFDRKEVLNQKDVKKKFENSKLSRMKFREVNCQAKEYDIVHAEYHIKVMEQSRMSLGFLQRQSFRKSGNFQQSQQQHNNNPPSFVFDLDESIHPDFQHLKKQQTHGLSQQETRVYDGQNSQGINPDNGAIFFNSYETNCNSKFIGSSNMMMGVSNIREIKKIIVGEVNQKGWTTLEEINKLMMMLSPQQLFTIFLHLTNEHQFSISNSDDDQSTVILSQAKTMSMGNFGKREGASHLQNKQIDI